MREETRVMFCCLCVYSYVVRSSPDIIQQAPINWTRRMGRMQEEKLRGGVTLISRLLEFGKTFFYCFKHLLFLLISLFFCIVYLKEKPHA